MRKALITFCVGTGSLLSGVIAPELLPAELAARQAMVNVLFVVAILSYAFAGFFWLTEGGSFSKLNGWFVEHVRWRFAPRKPNILPEHLRPDITALELIHRIMRSRDMEDRGDRESLERMRAIAQEIKDEISLRKLTVWARSKGVLDRLPHEIAKHGIGIGRDTGGNVYQLTQIIVDDASRNFDDFRFIKAEVDEIWPPSH